ncbi:MAG: hypothetical protein JO097_08925 [Acidobacteriaceae bacterium]|nr:hypothetical protein [Acidobacteriaceae bacterium]MBV9296403.1 hypothetical protein [Acidobacteriaceae bacterium]MBV9764385.1 hypothetical protein [Acidobacteriaceae bacterium]
MSPDRRQLEIQKITKDIEELQRAIKDEDVKRSPQWRHAEAELARQKRKLHQLRRSSWERVFFPPFPTWLKVTAAALVGAVILIALAETGVASRVKDMFQSRPVLAPSLTTAKIKPARVSIFVAPSLISKSLYEAERGESIHVLELPATEPHWIKVQLVRDGRAFPIGFMQREYLTFDASQELKWALNSPPPESDGMDEIGNYVTRLEDFQPPRDLDLQTRYYTALAKWEEILAQRQTSPEAAKPYKDKAATYRSYAGQNAPQIAKTGSTEVPTNQASGSSQQQSINNSTLLPRVPNTGATGTTAPRVPLSESALAEVMQRAEELYRAGEYDKARRVLDFLLRRNPDFREARQLRHTVIEAKKAETEVP